MRPGNCLTCFHCNLPDSTLQILLEGRRCVFIYLQRTENRRVLHSLCRDIGKWESSRRGHSLLSVKAMVLLFLCSSCLRDLQSLSSLTFSQQITIYYVIRRVETACPPMTRQVTVFDTGNFPKKYSVRISSYPYKIIFNLKE